MPKIVDHPARREAIAETVWGLLGSVGLEAITVREVAREAGLSTGALAHYFASKDELLEFALALAHERAAERTRAVIDLQPAPRALREAALANLPLDEERRAEYHAWLAYWNRALGRPDLASGHAERYAVWRAVLAAVIRRGRRDGSLRADLDPKQEAWLLAAFVDGLGLHALFERDAFPRRKVTRLLDAQLARLEA